LQFQLFNHIELREIQRAAFYGLMTGRTELKGESAVNEDIFSQVKKLSDL